jgi:hypothetical protein
VMILYVNSIYQGSLLLKPWLKYLTSGALGGHGAVCVCRVYEIMQQNKSNCWWTTGDVQDMFFFPMYSKWLYDLYVSAKHWWLAEALSGLPTREARLHVAPDVPVANP